MDSCVAVKESAKEDLPRPNKESLVVLVAVDFQLLESIKGRTPNALASFLCDIRLEQNFPGSYIFCAPNDGTCCVN